MGKKMLLFIILLISPFNQDILSPWGPQTYRGKQFTLNNWKKHMLKTVINQHKIKMYHILSLYN